jgi:hypothetical protein
MIPIVSQKIRLVISSYGWEKMRISCLISIGWEKISTQHILISGKMRISWHVFLDEMTKVIINSHIKWESQGMHPRLTISVFLPIALGFMDNFANLVTWF